MLFFSLFCLVFPSLVFNQDFFTVQLAPSTLTSVPYLNGEITVYEHRANQSRYFLPPLAILQLNDTQILYNRFTNRYSVRLALVLWTEELHQKVLEYLRSTLNRCHKKNECQIKMIPIDRLRIVWKRLQALSNDYELDSSWMSNTILLSTIYFNIACTTQSACIHLRNDTLFYPEIFDGLELEYSTPTEKHLRRDVSIIGSHVMQTNMFASLKQMPSVTDTNTRYLLADDMNTLISEVIANVEMSDITDVGYVSHDDQTLLRDLLKNRIAINQEVLLGHTSKQWESVYWNSDNIRPDLTVKLLNEELSRRDNQDFNEQQNQIDTTKQRFNESANANASKSFDDHSRTSSKTNDTSGSQSSDTQDSKTSLTDTQSSNTRDSSSSSSTWNSRQQGDHASSASNTRSAHVQGGSSGFFGIGGRGASSSDVSSSNSNSRSSFESNSNANSEANREFTDQNDRNVNYESGSQRRSNARNFRNYLQQDNSNQDIRARDASNSDYQKLISMDNFARKNLDKSALSKYEENRRYLEIHGNRFEVKPVTAYRVNLGQFHETLKLVSKSIVVQRINSIHAIPIRAMGDSLILPPILANYKVNMDEKLTELKVALLESIEQKFSQYRQESRTILDQSLLNTTLVISKALSNDRTNNNNTDVDLRYLIKKSLIKTMNLQDMGLFDNGILDYYRHFATPIQKITISSLNPLKLALHFPNVLIEGMVCDDRINTHSVRLICQLFHNSNKSYNNARSSDNINYNQTESSCLFQTKFIKEYVPCPFILNKLVCESTSKTILDCSYQRPVVTAGNTCQSNEHVNVIC